MASVREANSIVKKQLALREQLWPNAAAALWDRKAYKGLATIPKTMPLILKNDKEHARVTHLPVVAP